MRRVLTIALFALAIVLSSRPAIGDTDLGGYAGSAEAAIVRIGIFEPAIPIPAEPQVDAGIGFARATTATGPSSRALASYLWPGDAVGDGLGVLLGNEALDYPVKTSSSYPATDTSPAHNAVQINDGNGMSTAADGETTRATVVGLGLGNGVGGLGSGLCTLLESCTQSAPEVDLPDPVAAAATVENLKSESAVVLKSKTVTATAHSVASGISILGGLITVDGLDLSSESTSDAVTGTARGTSKITGLKVLGQDVALGDPVSLGGSPSAPPELPDALGQLGITIDYLQNQKAETGAAGSLDAQGLTITVDVARLRNLLHLGGWSEPLAPLLSKIDQLGPLLTGLLELGTKIVITVGDVHTKVTANPAYESPAGTTTTPRTDKPAHAGGQVPSGAPPLPAVAPAPIPPTAGAPVASVTPVSVRVPGLGRVPTWFVLAGLALVGLVAWGIRGFSTWIFGGGSCLLGKSIGVPDLRKVRTS
jgi:hypothetical protein